MACVGVGVGLVMVATASCSGAPPAGGAGDPAGAGAEQAPSPPSREDVCDHLLSLLQQDLAKAGRTPGDQQLDAARVRCVAEEAAEQAEHPEPWLCRSGCLLEAGSLDEAGACDARCPLPQVNVDCDAVLTAEDIQAALGAPARALPESEARDLGPGVSCARSFEVGGRPLTLSLALHRTSRGAAELVAKGDPKGTDVQPLAGIGDAARRYATPFEGVSLCQVLLARRRVSLHLGVAQEACAFAGIERLAATSAARLP